MSLIQPGRVAVLIALIATVCAQESAAQVSIEKFLDFKHGLATEYVAAQWRILVDNNLEHRQDMRQAVYTSIAVYLQRLVNSDSETFLLFDSDMQIVAQTKSHPTVFAALPELADIVARQEGRALRIETPIEGYVIGTLVPGIDIWLLMVSETR